jgi:uncharacterized damage-inducible protein DinB
MTGSAAMLECTGAVDREGSVMDEHVIRKQLEALVLGEGAHVPLERALDGLPAGLRGKRPTGLAHSVWELLEHIRIAQEDLLQYALDPDWVSPSWPDGYWPADPAPASAQVWDQSLDAFRRGRDEALALLRDSERDLTAPIPHAGRHTLVRQLMLLADHNAYHGAQIVDVRRALGAWPPG